MKVYRRILWLVLVLALVAIGVLSYLQIMEKVPENMWLRLGEEEEYDLNLPLQVELETDDIMVVYGTDRKVPAEDISIDLGDPFTLMTDTEGEYTATVKLFGWIPVGEISVGVMEDMTLLACGTPVGMYLETDGILALGTGEFSVAGGGIANPAKNIVRSGDYIVAVNGTTVTTKEDLTDYLQENGTKAVTLTLRRNGAKMDVRITPVCSTDGTYKIGVWIRDDSAGIGTLTYINPDDGTYGALGHGVSDGDTGTLFQVSGGKLYEAEVLSVVKGQRGEPGELVGTMCRSEDTCLGTIEYNGREGIFGGSISDKLLSYVGEQAVQAQEYPIALRQEIRLGSAYILNGYTGTIEQYSIEIEEVRLGAENNKGLVIHVTDERLLEETGGIVQGMSGSPIIQNGKIIGAVTHVLVNDPTRGYGIFIEHMIEH